MGVSSVSPLFEGFGVSFYLSGCTKRRCQTAGWHPWSARAQTYTRADAHTHTHTLCRHQHRAMWGGRLPGARQVAGSTLRPTHRAWATTTLLLRSPRARQPHKAPTACNTHTHVRPHTHTHTHILPPTQTYTRTIYTHSRICRLQHRAIWGGRLPGARQVAESTLRPTHRAWAITTTLPRPLLLRSPRVRQPHRAPTACSRYVGGKLTQDLC